MNKTAAPNLICGCQMTPFPEWTKVTIEDNVPYCDDCGVFYSKPKADKAWEDKVFNEAMIWNKKNAIGSHHVPSTVAAYIDGSKTREQEMGDLRREVAMCRERLGPAGYKILQEVLTLRQKVQRLETTAQLSGPSWNDVQKKLTDALETSLERDKVREQVYLEVALMIEQHTREDVKIMDESGSMGVRAEDYYSWRFAQELRGLAQGVAPKEQDSLACRYKTLEDAMAILKVENNQYRTAAEEADSNLALVQEHAPGCDCSFDGNCMDLAGLVRTARMKLSTVGKLDFVPALLEARAKFESLRQINEKYRGLEVDSCSGIADTRFFIFYIELLQGLT